MYTPSKKKFALLEDIDRRIDPEVEEDLQNQWKDFLYGRFDGDIFTPRSQKVTPPGEEIPEININDAIADYDMMMQSQLAIVSRSLAGTTESLCVRANYGTGILSSVFGAEIFIMSYENDTLPTTRALNDTEVIRSLVEAGMPDLETGFGKRVFEMGEIYREVFKNYPKIQKYVPVYHPDLQGPLDIAELLWGGEMFYAMYDEPELVHDFLTLITDTYIAFLERWFKMFPPREDMNPHWTNLWHRGAIALRNDSAMNLSPALYEEFSVPYDGKLLEHFGGGIIHFCGRGDHYIKALSELPGIYGVQMSQPHYNNMETIYQNTVDKGLPLLAFKYDRALADIPTREGGLRHLVSGKP